MSDKKKLTIIIGIPLIILIIFLVPYFIYRLHLLTPQTWITYENNDYSFSIKHPLFYGSQFYIPSKFTDETNCGYRNASPPKPSKIDKLGKIEIYESEFRFLFGSGECDGALERYATARDFSIYIFTNNDNIDFDSFINASLMTHNESDLNYDPILGKYVPKEFDASNYNIKQSSLEGKENAVVTMNSREFFPFKYIYYQKLPSNKILIIIDTRSNVSSNLFTNVIKTLNINNSK